MTDEAAIQKTAEDAFGSLSIELTGEVLAADNLFSFDTVQVGDEVGAMEVSEVDESGVSFVGEITVTGESYRISDMGPSLACLKDLDAVSITELPRDEEDLREEGWSGFCFSNGEEAESLLPAEDSQVTVVISEFFMTPGYPDADLAVLKEVK